MSDAVMTTEKQLVVFDLAGEHYGVDIATVREIIQMQMVTKVPGSASFVEEQAERQSRKANTGNRLLFIV